MSSDRFVVLGLAHVRSVWFRDVGRWATSAAVPIDFVKCVSIDELRARLLSGRAFSAVVTDAGLTGIDRDLIDLALSIGCAVVTVSSGADRRDHLALGASAVLPERFGRADLLAVLDEHTRRISSVQPETVAVTTGHDHRAPAWTGRLVAVTGVGGTGTSVLSMALARGLAADIQAHGRVLLADLALDADQAMLHDARDIVPGVQELADACRHGVPSSEDIVGLTFGDDHPYRLLLGLRRHRDWTTLRPRAWHTALDALRRTFTNIVADIDPDLEGETSCGSLDVEDRNMLARSVVESADVVVVTTHPGIQGLHRIARIIDSVVEHGADPDRILPVVNRSPRSGRERARLAHTLATLTAAYGNRRYETCAPVFVGQHPRVDIALHDGVALPAAMITTITAAVDAVHDRCATKQQPALHDAPQPIVPGSLGSWNPDHEATA